MHEELDGVDVTIISPDGPTPIPTGTHMKWAVVMATPPPMTIAGSGGPKEPKTHVAAPSRKVVISWDDRLWDKTDTTEGAVLIFQGGGQSVWLRRR